MRPVAESDEAFLLETAETDPHSRRANALLMRFLIERATQGRPTSYTELNEVLWNRTGLRRFDFSRADERAAMGYLRGSIVDDTSPRTKLMISAIVPYLNEIDATN